MSKNKKIVKGIYTYYDVTGGKLVRKQKKCPRCGSFMAKHAKPIPRRACGRCSYTEYLED